MDTKNILLLITDTEKYFLEYLTQRNVTVEDRMTRAIHFLLAALKDVTNSIWDSQLEAIGAVRAIFENWQTVESLPPVSPKPIVPFTKPAPLRYPAPTSKGDQDRDRVTTSKGSFKQQTPVIPKGIQVAVNSMGD